MRTLHLQSFPHSLPNLGSARISQTVKAHPIWVRFEPGADLLGYNPPLSLFALYMFRDFISFQQVLAEGVPSKHQECEGRPRGRGPGPALQGKASACIEHYYVHSACTLTETPPKKQGVGW